MRNLFHFSDYNFAGICAFLFFFLHLVCSVCAMNYAFLCRCCCFWLLLLYDSISPIAMYDCTKHAFQLLLKKHIDLFRKIAVSLDSININPFGFWLASRCRISSSLLCCRLCRRRLCQRSIFTRKNAHYIHWNAYTFHVSKQPNQLYLILCHMSK